MNNFDAKLDELNGHCLKYIESRNDLVNEFFNDCARRVAEIGLTELSDNYTINSHEVSKRFWNKTSKFMIVAKFIIPPYKWFDKLVEEDKPIHEVRFTIINEHYTVVYHNTNLDRVIQQHGLIDEHINDIVNKFTECGVDDKLITVTRLYGKYNIVYSGPYSYSSVFKLYYLKADSKFIIPSTGDFEIGSCYNYSIKDNHCISNESIFCSDQDFDHDLITIKIAQYPLIMFVLDNKDGKRDLYICRRFTNAATKGSKFEELLKLRLDNKTYNMLSSKIKRCLNSL